MCLVRLMCMTTTVFDVFDVFDVLDLFRAGVRKLM